MLALAYTHMGQTVNGYDSEDRTVCYGAQKKNLSNHFQ